MKFFAMTALIFTGLSSFAGLEFRVVPQQAYIQDSDYNGDCGYVYRPFIAFNRVSLSYNGGGSFIPSHMRIQFVDPAFNGGKYNCTVSGPNFTKLFGGKPVEVKAGETVSSSCPVICGAFETSSARGPSLYGKAKIYGFELDPNGFSSPTTAEIDLEVLTDIDSLLNFHF